MKKPYTLKDIARATGVHASTVSRALDPHSKTSLTDEVAQRIRATAKQMGYRPNRIAAGLRTNRSLSVGIMIPDITNTLFPPIVRGIESVLEPLGYTSIIVNTDDIPERESRLIDVLRERGVDGIINGAAQREDPKISEIAATGVPIVALNRRIEHSDIPFVINDEPRGIRLLLQHLHKLGHRKIRHIAGPQNLSTGQLRLTAFCEGCTELGIGTDAATYAISTRYDEAEGLRCAEQLFTANPDLTAIVCANDRLALGALEFLRLRGLDCPGDVSVTGFNDMPFLDLIPTKLTTIKIQQFAAGQTCARILFSMMNDPPKEVPAETILPVELMVRESVGPPRQTA